MAQKKSRPYPAEPALDPTAASAQPPELPASPQPAAPLSHLGPDGSAQMVDVSAKQESLREAVAEGFVRMRPETLAAIAAGNAPKGDVLGTARIAGIMAAKQTAALIPLCHPLPLHKITVNIVPEDTVPEDELPGYRIEATVRTRSQTGVEMEALTAVSVAALTLYDMAKALEKSIVIENIRLVRKSGGKSGNYQAEIRNFATGT